MNAHFWFCLFAFTLFLGAATAHAHPDHGNHHCHLDSNHTHRCH